MNTIEDACAQHALLPEGESTLFDALPQFGDDISEDVTADELSLSASPEPIDEANGGSGSSLPATPAERPCTFCPASLPLPPATGPSRVTLVLDLDGTLIASEELNAANSAYLWNPHGGVRDPDYEAMGRRVWLRPGVREFLAAVRPHFEIVLFTAATQNWAAAAIEQLDPSAYLFDVMLHRDHTTSDMMWDYVKDLSRLGRDLSGVVIVDDNPLMFMYQPDNALQIGAYEAASAGGPDNALERVAELLVGKVAVAEDVREVLGPMARAKTCIASTLNAKAAPAPAAEAAGDVPCLNDGADVPPSADATAADTASRASLSERDGAAETVDYGVEAADAPDSDPMACDSAVESVAADGCSDTHMQRESESCEEEGDAQQDEQQCSEGAPRADSEDGNHSESEEEKEEDASGRVGSLPGCPVHGQEGGFSWGCESEIPEIFDEHGLAASLGTGSWQEHNVGSEEGAALAECFAGAAESSDPNAAVAEEHDSHADDEFDALMEDAIAEYDSDAYEGQCDDGMTYDGECPTATAAVAAAAAGAASATADEFPSLRGCSEHEGCMCGCVLRTCAFDFGCASLSAHDIFGSDSMAVEEQAGVAASGCDALTSLGSCGAPHATLAAAPMTDAVPPASDLPPVPEHAPKASGDAAAPAGMVFLTDLHPLLDASNSTAEAGSSPCGAEPLGAAGVALRQGCKRAREEGADAPHGVAVPQSRLRLEGSDGVLAVMQADVVAH